MGEHVEEVRKRGEWYTVKGSVDGRQTSVDIPANQVEGKGQKDARKLFERGLRVTDNARE